MTKICKQKFPTTECKHRLTNLPWLTFSDGRPFTSLQLAMTEIVEQHTTLRGKCYATFHEHHRHHRHHMNTMDTIGTMGTYGHLRYVAMNIMQAFLLIEHYS